MSEAPDRNLALELVRVTEAAALASARWVGFGDKEAADQAAVDAMRHMLATVEMDGVVVIGEGEKDEAPMLFNGERIGTGSGVSVDVAVDPLEGTELVARGQPNALAVVAAAESGTMFDPGPVFYMEKLACGADVDEELDMHAPDRGNPRARRPGSARKGARPHGRDPRPAPPRRDGEAHPHRRGPHPVHPARRRRRAP